MELSQGEIVAIKSISKDKLRDEEALQMEVEFLKLLGYFVVKCGRHPVNAEASL